jgi:hypothetical protein
MCSDDICCDKFLILTEPTKIFEVNLHLPKCPTSQAYEFQTEFRISPRRFNGIHWFISCSVFPHSGYSVKFFCAGVATVSGLADPCCCAVIEIHEIRYDL